MLLAAFSLTFGKNVLSSAHAAPRHTTETGIKLNDAERAIIKARDAFDRRDLKALHDAANAFARAPMSGQHPLAPYLAYWRMSATLMQNPSAARDLSDEVDAFLRQHAATPAGDGLLREWLRALGKIDWWPPFGTALASYRGDDLEIACQRIRYRLAMDERGVSRQAWIEAKGIFQNASRPAPDPCHELFVRMRAEKQIENADVWKRVRGLFLAGHLADARRSVQLADNVGPGFEAASARAHLDPRQFLRRAAADRRDAGATELVAFALSRLARASPAEASAWLDQHASRFDADTADVLWAEIATAAAMQHDGAALEYFARVRQAPLGDTQAAWKARAALRAGNWRTVSEAIGAMSAKEQREPAWRYWSARAKQQTGDTVGAEALRAALAAENHFYGLLAAEERGVAMRPTFQPVAIGQHDIERVAALPGLRRALALFKLDLRNEGLREWQYAMRDMDDTSLLAAAEVGRVNDLPDRAISASERTLSRHDLSQRYPIPHRELLQARARSAGLDEAWVYGLIRQESRFMAEAKSHAGAVGLMQLMPATAKWAAKQVGMNGFSMARIADVPVNLSLGSYYLRHVLDDLGHAVLATAAYNAGPGRARRWRAEGPLEGAIYAETIPFNETRDYVKNVMLNKWYYAHRLGNDPGRLRDMLGIVPGKQQTALAAAALHAASVRSEIIHADADHRQ